MPRLSRFFIKTGMIFFVCSLLLLLWTAVADMLPEVGRGGRWMPVFWHMLMVGWITQIIMGVSYWMFPKISRDNHYGPAWVGWSCYGLLNVGLILRVVTEPWLSTPGAVQTAAVAGSALMQWIAGVLYIFMAWSRVRGRRRRKRKKKSKKS